MLFLPLNVSEEKKPNDQITSNMRTDLGKKVIKFSLVLNPVQGTISAMNFLCFMPQSWQLYKLISNKIHSQWRKGPLNWWINWQHFLTWVTIWEIHAFRVDYFPHPTPTPRRNKSLGNVCQVKIRTEEIFLWFNSVIKEPDLTTQKLNQSKGSLLWPNSQLVLSRCEEAKWDSLVSHHKSQESLTFSSIFFDYEYVNEWT